MVMKGKSKYRNDKKISRMQMLQAFESDRRSGRLLHLDALRSFKRKFDANKTKMLMAALGQQFRWFGRYDR